MKIAQAGLKAKTEELLKIIESEAYQTPHPYENHVGDLKGAVLIRINIQHRLVYQVIKNSKTIKVIRMWSYYE